MFVNWIKILKLAIPSILTFAVFTLSGTINLIIVSPLGATTIAIVAVSNIIMYNFWALFSGIGHSINYLISQNFGSNTMDKGVQRTQLAIIIYAIIGGIVAVLGLLFADDLLKFMGGEKSAAITAGANYLEIRIYAMAFGLVNFMMHGFFRGIGDTKTPMYISISANAVLVVFTYGLTFGKLGMPELGLMGAAWAFFIHEVVGLSLSLLVFFGLMHKRFNTRRWLGFSWPETKLLSIEGFKLGVQEVSISISVLLFTKFVAVLGTTALAANEVALTVMSLGFMPAFAFGSTATILVGQAVGEGKPLDGRRYAIDVAVMGTLFILIVGTIEFLFALPIAKFIAASEPEVYILAAELIMISAFLQVFDGIYNYFAGALRGIGETKFLLWIAVIFSFGLFVPLSYLNVYVWKFGSYGAWLSLYIYLIAIGLAVGIKFWRVKWSEVRMVEAHS